MAGQTRKKWAQAAMCAVALATPLAVSGCASQAGSSSSASGGTPSGTPGSTGAAGASTSAIAAAATTATTAAVAASTSASSPAPASSASSSAPLNGTGGTGLVVADGSSKVLMNGTVVDFGTEVHEPAFSPDGGKVAFIDGGGNLVVANADGSGQVEVAKNPGGQKWSHPTWQVTPKDEYLKARDNIFFASTAAGGTLWSVVATRHDGPLSRLSLTAEASGEEDAPQIPQEGNRWPSGAGKFGAAVYEHDSSSSSDIYVRDDYLRQQGRMGISNAAEPSYALVGGSATTAGDPEVAFVRKVNGHEHVFVSTVQTSTGGGAPAVRDLTPDASSDCSSPAISPDGRSVAYSTSGGVFVVGVNGGGAPKQVTDVPGFPVFRG